jgi:uncharacterized protein YndB with AHSA1/START domain
MNVHHSTIVLEREYPVPPAKVFAAWSDKATKARWFACGDDWETLSHELDFRVGGEERLSVRPPGGEVHRNATRFHDILPGERIVWTYDMYVGDRRITVSLATVVFVPTRRGTRMVFTEQLACLDGVDGSAERREGTEVQFEKLAAALGAAN